ncbi:MAG: hypothetical protein AAFO79_04015 [Pseudomonadota bacterium]
MSDSGASPVADGATSAAVSGDVPAAVSDDGAAAQPANASPTAPDAKTHNRRKTRTLGNTMDAQLT